MNSSPLLGMIELFSLSLVRRGKMSGDDDEGESRMARSCTDGWQELETEKRERTLSY